MPNDIICEACGNPIAADEEHVVTTEGKHYHNLCFMSNAGVIMLRLGLARPNIEPDSLTFTEYEYAGRVRNLRTGEYETLFTTYISPLLAENRAREKAERLNELVPDYRKSGGNDYDVDDIVVFQRTVTKTHIYTDWVEREVV